MINLSSLPYARESVISIISHDLLRERSLQTSSETSICRTAKCPESISSSRLKFLFGGPRGCGLVPYPRPDGLRDPVDHGQSALGALNFDLPMKLIGDPNALIIVYCFHS